MNRAIFLDRDNTLIHNDEDLGDPSQVKLIQGAASAIASLRGLGYRIIVVTNQGGVARGKFTEADVEAVNARVNELIVRTSGASIDRFYYCPYHPQGTVEKYRSEHPWRKPAPGMLLQAAADMQLDMGQSWMVGDQMRDVQAGAAAGVRTILLTPQAGAAQPPLLQDRMAAEVLGKPGEKPPVMPDFIARNIIEAVRIIAQQRRPEGAEDWRSLESSASSSATGATATGTSNKPSHTMPVALSPATQRLSHATKTQSSALATSDAASIPTPSPTAPVTPPSAPPAKITTPSPAAAMTPDKPSATSPSMACSSAEPGSTPPVATTEPVISASLVCIPMPVIHETAVAVHPSIGSITTASVAQPVKPRETLASCPASSQTPATPAPTPTAASSSAASTTTPATSTSHVFPTRPAATGPAASASRPVPPAPTVAPVNPSPGLEQTLRQILAELRNQRQPIDEFNYAGTMAIMFQLLAVVCLLAALWMGRSDDGLFLRWLGVSVLTQLIAIAMLLFKR